MVIQYFKKDAMAKPLFGIFRLGRKNSIAAEYAGRSSAVWEWDARDIDRFIIALESNSLIPKVPYKKQDGPTLEDRYFDFWGLLKKPVKLPSILGKRIKADYQWNSHRLRKEFGGDLKDIIWDTVNQALPLAMIFLLWQYFKKSYEEEAGGKKK